jgi:hypothetical protein
MKTANNLHPPAFIRLFPAKLNEGNVPLINKACRIGFNASSASNAPFSRWRSDKPHSIFRMSASASAAWRFNGVSMDNGAGWDGGSGRSGGRRTIWICRGRGGGGKSYYVKSRYWVYFDTYFECTDDPSSWSLFSSPGSILVQQYQSLICPIASTSRRGK